ncbi:3-ketoacyl-CoA thiolase [Klebsiella pneumoniae]|uniref:3-ketoacyl-CoA thiolase n=1 Tax=Klebsiella pneumoniae TaxID=573 RepID=A0A377V916_KLEPN|nr:3-ketoacyl-CoA thiolase [Klebsiella pneumoniae]
MVIAGGQENMSRAPHVLTDSRTGAQLGNSQLIDSLVHDGLWDAFNDYHMGVTAENLAGNLASVASCRTPGRSAHSIRRARRLIPVAFAMRSSRLSPSITARRAPWIPMNNRGWNASAEGLASLQPTFDRLGSVTAGNASSINDGAAAVMMMSEAKALELGLPILARIRAFASVGVDPALMGIAPVHATRRCLERAGWRLDDVDLIEANEAFAAQAISVGRVLEWDERRVNVNGGAIALGHPIGASGCRILVSLVHEMIKRDARKGLATLCIGGGQGVALAVERA